MKKLEKYYAVNKQEDEDGYTLYPGNALIYKNTKKKPDISTRSNTANTKEGSAKQLIRNLILSPSQLLSRIKEK